MITPIVSIRVTGRTTAISTRVAPRRLRDVWLRMSICLPFVTRAFSPRRAARYGRPGGLIKRGFLHPHRAAEPWTTETAQVTGDRPELVLHGHPHIASRGVQLESN